ncbi:outer membrane beta-barrel protein [Ornithobacterium rhinotracheale]|uniref:outer membrane beta-barrel protein n=1 Tax=Ornithobacterium rhinotracheale TaxID=28251 RepID=UPI00403750E5
MKKTFLFFVLLSSFWAMAQEQTCTYRGILLDSLSLPVIDASISAFDAKNQSAGYTFSDKNGEFKLDMPCGKKYELEIEHLNYKSKIVKVDLQKSMREKIQMATSSVGLKEIVAQGVQPITIKGDTIEYDAASFKSGTEENLEDILKKLPGLSVEDGKIYYQGKEMKSIKVEGREIFGGNQKLVTKNLPSDAVSKVQLNKKFKSNPFANSVQADEDFELNIVLEENKKNLVFGNATIGGDAHKHTDLQEKLFYFSKKTDATLISDYNTYGKEVFTSSDYFQFLGGNSEFNSEGGTSSLRNAMGNVSFNTDDNASITRNFLSAGNLGYQPNKNLNISGFAMGTQNSVEYNSTSERLYPNFEQKDLNQNHQKIFAFISRLNVEYISPKNLLVKYRVNFNLQNAENDTRTSSFINQEENPSVFRNTQNKRDNAVVNQKLSLIKKIKQDDNLGFYFSHIYQKETPTIDLLSSAAPFGSIFNLMPQNKAYQLNQNKNFKSNTFQFLSIYNHLLTNKSNLRLKLGANYTLQDLNNQLKSYERILNNDKILGDSDFNFQEYYADASYKRVFFNRKLSFTAGLTLNYFNSENKPENALNNQLSKTNFLPHFEIKYRINNFNDIGVEYDNDIQVPSINEWTPGYAMQSYFSLYEGNPSLGIVKNQKINLRYNYYNAFKFMNLHIGGSYNRIKEGIKVKGVFDGQNQISTAFNADFPDEIWSARFFSSKRFSKLYSLKINGNYSHSTYQSVSNNISYKAQSQNHNYKINNTFKWNKKLEISLGADASFSQYKLSNRDNKFSNLTPFAEAAVAITDKILLKTEYSYFKQWQDGKNINDFQGLDASLRIKPAKKTYINFIAGNLLNDKTIVSSGFNDFYTYVFTKETLGRYFLVQVRYKF